MDRDAGALPEHRIVVDWGTSSFRAALIGADDAVLDTIETADGISRLTADAFEPLLMNHLSAWFEHHGPVPVACCGMITSRNGWVEVPYADCPAGPRDLLSAAHRTRLRNSAPLVFIGGLRDPAREPFPDVMRGEETQIVGFGLSKEMTIVLPGTHSKWARVAGGRIASFQTFVTGELFALLSEHSFIARSLATPASPDWAAFERAARYATNLEQARSVLSDVFSARTGVLAGALEPASIADHLSGLVIGHEFRAAREAGWIEPGGRIGIVGNSRLAARYERLAGLMGLAVAPAPEDAAYRGALAILSAGTEPSP